MAINKKLKPLVEGFNEMLKLMEGIDSLEALNSNKLAAEKAVNDEYAKIGKAKADLQSVIDQINEEKKFIGAAEIEAQRIIGLAKNELKKANDHAISITDKAREEATAELKEAAAQVKAKKAEYAKVAKETKEQQIKLDALRNAISNIAGA